MPFWERLLVVGIVVAATAVLARLVDRRIARRDLPPEAATRYRVLRRSVTSAIVAVGLLSALLVVPQVRAVAGGILASSAIVGLVVGFAAQSTLSNFVAGITIAFTQPLRLADEIEVTGVRGTVEEIGLIYTFIRTDDGDRLVIPNSKLASDTIRNSTIRSPEQRIEITVQVPLATELAPAVAAVGDELAHERRAEAFVSSLDDAATITARAWFSGVAAAEPTAGELRLRVHERLRTLGILS